MAERADETVAYLGVCSSNSLATQQMTDINMVEVFLIKL